MKGEELKNKTNSELIEIIETLLSIIQQYEMINEE